MRRLPPSRSRRSVIRAGAPYHLLARNSSYRWWRPLLALLVFTVVSVLALVGAMMLLVLLAALPHLVIGDAPGDAVQHVLNDPIFTLFVGFLALVVLMLAVWVTVRWAETRPFRSVSSVVGGLRWKWLGDCQVVALVILGAAFGTEIAYDLMTGTSEGGGFQGWTGYARVALIALLIVPFQSAAEEYAFRGFLLQTLTAWFRTPWVGMALSSVLFVLCHGYTDPLVWFQLFVMGMTMCWLTVRTGGLEAAIALHATNNVLSLLVTGFSGVPNLEQAGDFAVMDVVPLLVAVPVYAWIVDRRAARHEVGTVIGGRLRIRPVALQVAGPATPR